MKDFGAAPIYVTILPDEVIEEDEAERFADRIVWIEGELRVALGME